jgi:hypothetical protein
MNRRREDDLIRLAFGELSPEEAAELKRSVDGDSEAIAALSVYSEMAAGLKELPVADCQLSSERLRDAILSKGLGRPAAGTGFRWVWAPAALALLILAIPLARRFQGEDPVAAARIEKGSRSVAPPAMETTSTPRFKGSDPAPEMKSLSSVTPSRPASTVSRDPSPRLLTASRSIPAESRVETVALLARAELDVTALETAVSDAAVPDGATESIVIIGAETDANTGARRATEVPTASNVVVGG